MKTDTVASMSGVLSIIVECRATWAFEDSGHIMIKHIQKDEDV